METGQVWSALSNHFNEHIESNHWSHWLFAGADVASHKLGEDWSSAFYQQGQRRVYGEAEMSMEVWELV